MELREKKITRREFIQYLSLYKEKLKKELEDAPPKQLVLKDKIIWYAEPATAKASDSLTVDATRWSVASVVVRLPLILLPARSSWGNCRAGLR